MKLDLGTSRTCSPTFHPAMCVVWRPLVETSENALSSVKTTTSHTLSAQTVGKENEKRGLRESRCFGALFLCGSEISVLLKGDICARLPGLLTSSSDWELAPDTLAILRRQKRSGDDGSGRGEGLLVEKVPPAKCADSARDGGELRTFRNGYTGQ